jgi:transcriptional regulator with XRE-family HTH domain
MANSSPIPDVLAEVGPRLKRLRTKRGVTLTALAAQTGISKSTLSRLESGQRKPSLELLLPLAEAHQVPLDELVDAPDVGDPRIRLKPRVRNGRMVFPLTQQSSGLQVWKVVIPSERERELRTHEGYEWLYVLSGEVRLIIGEHDITMEPGEVAEFDTRLPALVRPIRRRARRDPQRPRKPRATDARPRGTASQDGDRLTESADRPTRPEPAGRISANAGRV